MRGTLRRIVSLYSAIAAMAVKTGLAYTLWVWAALITQVLAMIVFVYFWRAVYAGQSTLGGLTLTQTLNYILLARILSPLVETRLIFHFGFLVRQGQFAIEFTRPLDLQARYFAEGLAEVASYFIQRLPLFVIAALFFGLSLPSDPALWLAFGISLLLGYGVLFFFDWTFASFAFYSTETWGLSVVRVGAAAFFSGSLVPLSMMPEWLQTVAAALPFAQALAVPLSFLSGIATLAEAPRLWLIQLTWLVGLWAVSRWFFSVASRKVTVQGG
jgi:ABC-2 type transport system permease protein